MSVLINFKICDNAQECGGINVCPTGALYWDEESKHIAINNKKCISCGKCVSECPVNAIFVAKNVTEHKKIQQEIDLDDRKRTDLFVDRYGAQPIQVAFLISENDFKKEVLESEKIIAVEFFSEESIMCLLKSIPIKELFKEYLIEYRKMKVSQELIDEYVIRELPALLFFKEGKLLGKIEGYFEKSKKEELATKINKILE